MSANIFSQSTCCLFLLLMVSFAVQKLISLIRFPLFIFALISFALGDWSKKILLQFMPENFLPMFSPRSFLVSRLTLSLFLCMVWGSILASLIHVFDVHYSLNVHRVLSPWSLKAHFCTCCILSHFWSLVQTLLCHDLPARVVPTSAGARSTVSITSVILIAILLTRHICPNRLWAPRSWDLS